MFVSPLCLQFAAVLDGVLSKLSRYDEGTFFSSILSFTVSSHVFVPANTAKAASFNAHWSNLLFAGNQIFPAELQCPSLPLLPPPERWKQLPNMWKSLWVRRSACCCIIHPVYHTRLPYLCFYQSECWTQSSLEMQSSSLHSLSLTHVPAVFFLSLSSCGSKHDNHKEVFIPSAASQPEITQQA